jgi:hypothetical protein
LHVPSNPQVAASARRQASGERGSAPLGTNEQVPGASGRLHTLHVSVHPVSQQTPSTQKPLAQSAAQAQAWPFAWCAPEPLQSEGAPPSGGEELTPPQPSASSETTTIRREK